MAAPKQKKTNEPNIWRFFISKTFWLNIAVAAVIFIGILWLTLLFLQSYSRHGESQTVPNVVGMTTLEAMQKLNSLDLEYAVMDSTYDPGKRPLSVINQDPIPDSKVKSGRKIYVTVNMANPPETEVPFIEIGTSLISVREILESRGLRMGDIIYKPFEYRDVYLDMYLDGTSKSLKPGSKIPKGSRIDLVMGNGLGDTKIAIPDFTGLTYQEAINLIQLKELSVGTVIATGTITDSLNAFVYKQYPASDDSRMMNIGSMVDIWISQDPMPGSDQDDNPGDDRD